jgi:ubiquinol-cytochrome c reductase cytochrome b/c1 subunit
MITHPPDRSAARDAGLFLVLVVLGNGLIVPGSTSTRDLTATFYLAVFIHLGFTIYDGRFGALRTATWLLLIGAWAGSELAAFFGLILPSGQIAFWLTINVPVAGKVLAHLLQSDGATLSKGFLFLVLGLDIAVMHYDGWRRRSILQIAVFLAAVGAAATVLGLALGAFINNPASNEANAGSFAIVPPWYLLPFYALLRALPNKLGGVVLAFASMLIPMIWPWMHADFLRLGPMHRIWSLLCLLLVAVWLALGYLGSRSPDEAVMIAAQALAVFYFAFFLIFPPLLGRIAAQIRT